MGQKIIEINDIILSREFSKQGCNISLRGKLWSQMLNVNLDSLVKFQIPILSISSKYTLNLSSNFLKKGHYILQLSDAVRSRS